MLPAGPNSAKPWSFLGYEGDDGTHGYFRLERLALAWPHAGEQWLPTAIRIWVETAKKYRKRPIALSCQRREGFACEIGEETRGESPCRDTANEDIAEASSKPRDLSVVARKTGGLCQGSVQPRGGAEGNLGTLEVKQ